MNRIVLGLILVSVLALFACSNGETEQELVALQEDVSDLSAQVDDLLLKVAELSTQIEDSTVKVDNLVSQTANLVAVSEQAVAPIPHWEEGTTLTEAKQQFQECFAPRLGLFEGLGGQFADAMLDPLVGGIESPFGDDELSGIQFAGHLMGCWQ